ncbi:MAG: hypothetical protein JW837_05285 [Sedimentisphaerales bacterium]|nr:hypothetical protein [Sedimentisphaerales bacterium]
MNPTKTTKFRNIFMVAAVIIILTTTGVSAQQKLGDLVEEGGYGWMIGKWEATTDDGEQIKLEYKWELDKTVIMMKVKLPEDEFLAMIYYKPTDDQVVQVTVGKKGGTGKGLWEHAGDKAILKHEYTDADWQTQKMAVVHSKVDNNTMKWDIHEIYSSGELADYPNATIELKRQKEPVEKTEKK